MLPKTSVKTLDASDSRVIYIKTHNRNYSQIPLINCNNQLLEYAHINTINSGIDNGYYTLNNIDVILPVYFANDSTYGYHLRIVGDPVINVSRTITVSSFTSKTVLYSSGFFEHTVSYPSTSKSKDAAVYVSCPYINIYSSISSNLLLRYKYTPTEISTITYGDNNSILKLIKVEQEGVYRHHFKVLNADCTGYSVAFRGYAF